MAASFKYQQNDGFTFFPRPPPRFSFSFLAGFLDAGGARPRSGCLASDLRELEGFLAAGLAASSRLTGRGAGRTFLKIFENFSFCFYELQ